MTMTHVGVAPCSVCRRPWTPGGRPCSRCRFLLRIGGLVEFILSSGRGLDALAALDDVADLLTEHAQSARTFRRELNDTIQDAQRDARDAYAAGAFEGREGAML